MTSPNKLTPLTTPGRARDKVRFIGIFAGTALAGVVLILLAVYNASRELAIVHQIDGMHGMIHDRVTNALKAASAPSDFAGVERLAKSLSSDAYPVLALPPSGAYAFDVGKHGLRIEQERIDQSRINERGGHIEQGRQVFVWVLVPVPGSPYRLLAVHPYQALSAGALFGVYQNRLIIPAAFYIWMTVWVSLILNNLVARLHVQKDAVERMAWHDPLTGLPNRNLFFKTLNQLVDVTRRNGSSLSLAVVDLDGFKQVNDTFGHDAGDELLRQVADAFRRSLRQGDMVARTGGDEFILLFPDSDGAGCRAVCERIVKELTSEYTLSQCSIRIGASMGVASYPGDAREIVELTRRADEAMYAAKRSGGGIACYSSQ